MNFVLITSIGAIGMAILVMFIRVKAAKKPATAKKIILPPIFMSTGALMFLHPYFRVSPLEIMEALAVGMLFSILLVKTSKFEIRNNDVYLIRSKAFMYILIGLLVLRIAMKSVLSTSIDYGELSGMFWILAFGMIVPWRVAMYLNFRKLQNQLLKH
jgi:membrane protein CcdC involved in cytochrome C biogenesis